MPIVLINAFGKGALRNKQGKLIKFATYTDAKKYMERNGWDIRGYNYFDTKSVEVFAKEEVEYLCQIQNNLAIANKYSLEEDKELNDYCYTPRLRFVENLDLGVYRLEEKGSGRAGNPNHLLIFKHCNKNVMKHNLRSLGIYKEDIPTEISIEEFNKNYEMYEFLITKHLITVERVKPDWVPDPKQQLFKVIKYVYVDENIWKSQVRYSAKFYKMVQYENWKEYPIFDGKISEKQ